MLLTEKVRDRPPLKRWRRRGYTMIELLVSLVGASILMAGLGSAIVITTQAVSPPGEQRSVLKAAEVTFIMADELQSSVHVVEQSATAVEFALSDRDGDGQTDIVRYEWDNTSHLLARHSENRHGTLLSDVSAFAIQPLFRSVPEELGGVVSESSQTTFNSSVRQRAGIPSMWTRTVSSVSGSTSYIRAIQLCGRSRKSISCCGAAHGIKRVND